MRRLSAAGALVLSLLFAMPLAAQTLPERTTTILRDTDFPGGDMRPIFDTTLTACDAACRADPDCIAFTFNSRSNACFPKSSVGETESYAGAFSGLIRTLEPEILLGAEARRSDLSFLSSLDFDDAYAQADTLGLTHYGGAFPADDWRRSALTAFSDGDAEGAMRRIGAAVTITGEAQDWITYATYLLAIEAENSSDQRRFDRRAQEAAVNAALRADPGAQLAQALDVLAEVLERNGRGRDALSAAEMALNATDTQGRAQALERLRGLYGFRVTDTRVDVEADFPRICAIFSEDLAAGGVNYDDFLQTTTQGLAVEAEGRQLCISGVNHGERLEFTLRAGLPAATGEVLHAPVALQQYVRDRAASVRFAGRAYVLPASAGGTIPLVAVNTDLVDLNLYHVSDRNILRSLQDRYFGRPLAEWEVERFADEIGEAVWQGEAEVAMEQNRGVITRLPIGDVLAGRAPGLYALEARVGGAGEADGGATQWFLVSDLGLSAASGSDGVHVSVTSLTSARPVESVAVDLVSESNRVLASGVTDADGYLHFAGDIAAGQNGAAPALLIARTGETDLAFLSLREAEFDLSDRGVEGREPAGPIDVFLTTDRGVYRAGETVHATALARDPQADAITGLPLTAILTRADGVEYSRTLLEDVGAGGYVFSLPIGPDVPRGTWRLAIHADPDAAPLTTTRLLVEDFLPERLNLIVSLPSDTFAPSAAPLTDFIANYLYGAPADGLPITGRMALRPTQSLPEYPGYAFGRHDAPPEAQFSSFGPFETNNQGRTAGALDFPEFNGSPYPGQLTVTAEITEASGRPVERRETVTVLPRGPAIGIRPLFDGTLAEGVEAPFDLIAIGTSGPMPARWTLNRVDRRYQWYRQNGNWSWDSVTTRERVAEGEVTLGSDPVRLDLPVDWGQYELRVESDFGGFTISSVGFSAGYYGGGDGADTPDVLDVSLDAESYRPGDTAILRISAQSGGFLTVQVVSDRVIHREMVVFEDAPTTVSLEVTEDWGSGAYITATLVRPFGESDTPAPTRAIGIAHATVDPGPRALDATLDMPDVSRPREPLDIALRVDGAAAGETVHATIAAVDVGILNLTSFEAPDPQGYYFGQRRLGVAFRDLYGRLIDSRDGAEGRIRQGGDAGAGLRMEASPPTEELVALFSGPLIVGEDGYARTSFDLPAFNGSVRVMATAWSETGVGQAAQDVIVRDPVVITATAPRFLAPGDTASLLLEVTHTEGPVGEMPLQISTTAGLRIHGQIVPEISLGQGETQRLRVRFTALDQTGPETFTLALTTPDGTELTRVVTIPIEVNDPLVAETTRLSLAPGQIFTLDAAAYTGFRPETARVTLSAGPLARFDAAGLLQRLDGYPYGCTEQVTSRALPLLYLSSVAEIMELGTADDLNDRIADAIRSVLTNQSANGSFGLWRAESGDLWLDAYVTDFLSRARNEGHDVPARAFQSALDNLANRVAGYPDFENGGEGLAYALMVLAREGQASMGDLRYYADVKADDFATPLALGQLGAALAMYGDQPRADRMFAAGFARLTLTGNGGAVSGWRDDYGSRTRDAAGLVALAAASGSETANAPDLIAVAATDVADASTQEAVWSLLAAHALIDNPATQTLTLDGNPVSGPFVEMLEGGDPASRVIENTGTTDEVLTLTRFGVPIGETEQFGNGYRIDRRYMTLEGHPVDPAQVAQGTRLVTLIEVQRTGAPDGRLMVNDPLPAGFEIDNPNLLQSGDIRALQGIDIPFTPVMSEFRADRFLAAIDMRRDDTIRLAYIVRAVSPGNFHHPAASVEDMYRPTFRAQTASGRVTVAE
ncbi:alpha-2-macroglobulin family protein [Rhodobacterales bacterium HKCCE4037]|nr:alpha-2-macroglobulin family protein [Rhodobacterales bacterium HKCCE4037]